jgi:hypothetical protein
LERRKDESLLEEVVPAGEFLRGWIPESWSHNRGGGGGHQGWFFVDEGDGGY